MPKPRKSCRCKALTESLAWHESAARQLLSWARRGHRPTAEELDEVEALLVRGLVEAELPAWLAE